jgi:hypothetical protein
LSCSEPVFGRHLDRGEDTREKGAMTFQLTTTGLRQSVLLSEVISSTYFSSIKQYVLKDV